MKEATRKKLFFLLLADVFAAMLVLNLLTPFAADDYLYSYSFATGERITNVSQIIPSLIAHGITMNGRYAPHFFVQLFTMLPQMVFDVVNAGVYVLLLLGLYALLRGEKRYDLGLLLALGGAVFVAVPDFGGCMLWLAGSCNYLWCMAGAVWLLKPFADAIFRGKAMPKAWVCLLLMPGGLLLGNFSENMSVVLALLLLGFGLYDRLAHKKLRWQTFAVGLAVLAGWLLLVLAQGDSGRIGRSGLGFYLERLQVCADYQRDYLMLPTVLCLYLLALGWYKGLDRGTIWLAASLFVGAMLCNLAMAAADYYPQRTLLWSVVLLIAACGLLAVPLAGQSRLGQGLWAGAVLHLSLLALLACLTAFPGNLDRYGYYQARMADMQAQRDAGQTEIVTYGILSKSKYDEFFGFTDLTTDPTYRVNVAMSKYLGVDSITVERFE